MSEEIVKITNPELIKKIEEGAVNDGLVNMVMSKEELLAAQSSSFNRGEL